MKYLTIAVNASSVLKAVKSRDYVYVFSLLAKFKKSSLMKIKDLEL